MKGFVALYYRGAQYVRTYGVLSFGRWLLTPTVWLPLLRGRLRRLEPTRSATIVVDRTAAAVNRLQGGLAASGKDELTGIIRSPSATGDQRNRAIWELARWHAVQGEFEAVLRYSQLIPDVGGSETLAKSRLLLETNALLILGRTDEASSRALLGLRRFPDDPDARLIAANTLVDCETRLALINHMYTTRDLLPIRKIDATADISFNNITAMPSHSVGESDGPLITVIVPVYNGAATIIYALRGLQEQTWRSLQVIVVDDASNDETCAIVSEVATRDKRISLVRLDENRGTYVGRNAGLERATGEWVTVHDADDWSHPQRLELQINGLLSGPYIGSTSYLVRASTELRFTGCWKPKDTLVEQNYSSFMLRTTLLKELGGWDPVRINADAELRFRLAAEFGSWRLLRVHEEFPLAFGLEQEGSLTRSADTHVRSVLFGMRSIYDSAYTRWHAAAQQTGDFRIDPDPSAPRRFPAPAPMLALRALQRPYDLVLIADFGAGEGELASTHSCLVAAIRSGFRVGLFHWPGYDDPRRDLDGRICELLDDFQADLLVPEQTLETKHLLLYDAAVFQHRIDQVPRISFERMHVIVSRMAERCYDGADTRYDPVVVRNNLEFLFDCPGEWYPISPVVRQLMMADSRYPPPGKATWMPLLETDVWCDTEAAYWRGSERKNPVIGRHTRDTEVPCRIPGEKPTNWRVWSYDAVDPQSFVRDLDFLVHFPNEHYIEELGRVAVEAMAAGVPVIVPPPGAKNFGDAAVCCEPGEVAGKIEELWRNEQRYLAQARLGREFVLQNCAFDQLRHRLGHSQATVRS